MDNSRQRPERLVDASNETRNMDDAPLELGIDYPHNRRRFLEFGILTAGTVVLAGCGGSSAPGGAKTASLTHAYPTVPTQLDPALYSGDDSNLTLGNVYATPVRFVTEDVGKGFPEVNVKDPKVVGWLAKSFEPSSDLRTFRLTLRDDVKSAFGNPLTSEDLRWTIERNMKTPGNGSIIVALAGLKGPSSVKVIDDHVVELRVSEPSRLMPQLLQNQFGFGVIDSVEAKKHATSADPYAGKWLAAHTAGFGPYQIQSRTTQRMVFVPNKGYFGPAPVFRPVRWLAVPESANRFGLIRSGEAQITNELEPQQQVRLAGSSGIKTYATDTREVSDTLFFNAKVPELKDPRVRQALAYATPYQGILDAVYRGTATKWQTPVGGKVYAGADPSLNPYTTDLTKARELMAAAGKKSLDVVMEYDTSSYWQKPVAIQLQTAWREIGVNASLVGRAPAVWGERLGKRQMAIFFVHLSWFVPDLFYVMNLLYKTGSGVNFGGYSNPKLDRVLAAGLIEPNATKRDAMAKDAQALLMADVPAITMGVRPEVIPIRSSIKGFTAWINGMVFWSELKKA